MPPIIVVGFSKFVNLDVSSSYMEVMNLMDILHNNRELDFEILKHVLAEVDASTSWNNISMCTDDAQVAGLSLKGSAFLLPNNICWEAVPQVSQHLK